MRVNQSGSNPVSNANASEVTGAKKTEKSAKKPESRSAAAALNADSVKSDISPRAKEFAKAKAVAGEVPDVREEKVAELKRRIAAGQYKVDADAIADRMVDEHIKSGIG